MKAGSRRRKNWSSSERQETKGTRQSQKTKDTKTFENAVGIKKNVDAERKRTERERNKFIRLFGTPAKTNLEGGGKKLIPEERKDREQADGKIRRRLCPYHQKKIQRYAPKKDVQPGRQKNKLPVSRAGENSNGRAEKSTPIDC